MIEISSNTCINTLRIDIYTMTYQDLLSLFYEGELEEVISKGEIYTLNHPTDTQAMLLQAVAHHDIAMHKSNYDHESAFEAIQNYVLPILRKALTVAPDNGQLLYNFLNYPLSNEYALNQIGRIKKHISLENVSEFVYYANRLKKIPEYEVIGYDFMVKIYESFEDEQKLLVAIDEFLDFNLKNFEGDRETRDENFAIIWPKRIWLLERLKKVSNNEIINEIQHFLPKFDTTNSSSYLGFAEIAMENNRWDVAVEVIFKWVYFESLDTIDYRDMIKWYHSFQNEFQNGFRHPKLIDLLLTIEHVYFGELGISNTTYYQNSLRYEQIVPNDFGVLLYKALYLFDEEKYAETLPLLQQAFSIQPIARFWRRILIARYHLGLPIETEDIPDLPNENNHPLDLYNQGVFLGEFLDELPIIKKQQLKKYQAILYQKSFENHSKYFNENAFETTHVSMRHNWAMCGNNYANVLYEYLNEYELALQILEESIKYSVFAELYATAIKIHQILENYNEVIRWATEYLENNPEEHQSFYRLNFESDIIDARHHLGQIFTIEELKQTLFEYYQFTDYPALDDYQDNIVFDNTVGNIERMIYQLKSQDSLEERLTFYEGIIAEFPEYPSSYFHLMQIYNELEDFEKVEWAVDRYLETKKPEAHADSNLEKAYFLKMKSIAFLERPDEAVAFFELNQSFVRSIMDDESWVYWIERIK